MFNRYVFIILYKKLTIKNKNGFTLIETLVSMLLLSITLVMIMRAFSSGLTSVNTSESYTTAVFYASEKMEEVFLYKTLSPGITTGEFNDTYSWETEIQQIENPVKGGDDGAKDMVQYNFYFIKVIVSWKFGLIQKDIKLTTLRSVYVKG